MENLTVKVEGDQKYLELRTGSALPLKEPKVVNVSGDINTISAYFEHRKGGDGHSTQGLYADRTIVFTDKSQRSITIELDPENPYGAKVVGQLSFTDELLQFGINTQKQYNRENLVKMLRFSKRFFKSPEVHLSILTSYQAFKASAKTEHDNASDTRGNKTSNFSKQVETNLPTNFVLSLPIFKGCQKEEFMVEICLELTDAGAHFWFESPELEELISIRTDQIFEEQLNSCDGFMVVNK